MRRNWQKLVKANFDKNANFPSWKHFFHQNPKIRSGKNTKTTKKQMSRNSKHAQQKPQEKHLCVDFSPWGWHNLFRNNPQKYSLGAGHSRWSISTSWQKMLKIHKKRIWKNMSHNMWPDWNFLNPIVEWRPSWHKSRNQTSNSITFFETIHPLSTIFFIPTLIQTTATGEKMSIHHFTITYAFLRTPARAAS